jgi:hypothetical protein
VWKQLNDWKLKFLSHAWNEILLKAVVQAIPTYGMSVFILLYVFKDLVYFNKALLAKHCWKLLQNPNSLVARIIKAKYYHRGTIIEATLCKRWRSILSTCDLLKCGLIWRIGDGSTIKIWGDKWLATLTAFSVQSLRRILAEDAKVMELIDPNTKWWNTMLLKNIFNKDEGAGYLHVATQLL